MQIAIELDDEMYKLISTNIDVYVLDEVNFILIENAIANGTPLPKGHGDLIDINEITAFKELECNGHNVESLDEFTVIIESDKESKSKELYTKVKDTSENHYYKENNDNSYPGYLCNEDGSVCR